MMPGMQMGQQGGQVFVLNQNMKRDQGRKAQLSNISAAKNIASIVRTTLGPKAMLKMLLDPMGGIVMTNDGHAILREIDVSHPAAKGMLELSRAQDEEVGDGTTTCIILAGEMMGVAEPLFKRNLHPVVITGGYMKAMEDALKILEDISITLDLNNQEQLQSIVRQSIDTKFVSRWGAMISDMALRAAQCVTEVLPSGKKIIDIKRYAKVEKIAGGELDDCKVLNGVMFNKECVHAHMRREIINPRVVLLDCALEYKKGESQTNVEISKEQDWDLLLRQEEEEVKKMCDHILAVKPDVLITEKGVSDLATHFLMKKNVSVIRRVRKTDNNRIARITGAQIVNRPEELVEAHVGMECGKFQIRKIGDEFFTFMTDCENPKACTVLLRGSSKDVLNEVERNLHDAFHVARNILLEPKLLPGGGATELELSAQLQAKGKAMEGLHQLPYLAVAQAFEVVPRTLAQNCGLDVVRVMTDLRARHAVPNGAGKQWGLSSDKNAVSDVLEDKLYDTFVVKQQCIRAAIENAAMMLRIDDVLSGLTRKDTTGGGKMKVGGDDDAANTFGDARDG